MHIVQIYRYWWRFAVYGIWAADSYVYYHPKNHGIGEIACQGQESKIGVAKKNACERGNGNTIGLYKTADDLDNLTFGALINNCVDLGAASDSYSRKKTLMYNPQLTERNMQKLIQLLPTVCIDFLNKFEQTQFNRMDTIDKSLFDIFSANSSIYRRCRLISDDVDNLLSFEIGSEDRTSSKKSSKHDSRKHKIEALSQNNNNQESDTNIGWFNKYKKLQIQYA